MKVTYEASQFRHGILVVRKPDMKYVVGFSTLEEAEAKAAELNAWPDIPAASDPNDYLGRLMGILDRLHGPDYLWKAA